MPNACANSNISVDEAARQVVSSHLLFFSRLRASLKAFKPSLDMPSSMVGSSGIPATAVLLRRPASSFWVAKVEELCWLLLSREPHRVEIAWDCRAARGLAPGGMAWKGTPIWGMLLNTYGADDGVTGDEASEDPLDA